MPLISQLSLLFATCNLVLKKKTSKSTSFCSTTKASAHKNKGKGKKNVKHKEASTQTENEALMLEEVCLKDHEEYNTLKEKQPNKHKILKSAMKTMSEEVIQKQNSVIAELSGVISVFKQDSYSDYEEE